MGDKRRFSLFADLIAEMFPDPTLKIVDIAGGKGGLKSSLRRLGYRDVTTWDKGRRLAKGRPGQRFQLFDYRSAPREYRLAVAMHPDEGTDHAILWAAKHGRPFVVCPCCVRPSAAPYCGPKDFDPWNRHLIELARAGRMRVEALPLPMKGRNLVLVGRPGV